MFWVCDFTKRIKYPFIDYITARRWMHYLEDIKLHDCEMDIMSIGEE
jgi:hypothetical protein